MSRVECVTEFLIIRFILKIARLFTLVPSLRYVEDRNFEFEILFVDVN